MQFIIISNDVFDRILILHIRIDLTKTCSIISKTKRFDNYNQLLIENVFCQLFKRLITYCDTSIQKRIFTSAKTNILFNFFDFTNFSF